MAKERIDVLLTDQGHYESREQAKRAIMAGLIKVNNEIVDKPGAKIPLDAEIIVKGELHPFVSRGGLKLVKAIESFDIDMTDKVVIDIGASTGGFTDCSLQYGAKEVYAVDVGYGQLAWTLRQDNRVHVFERTNFRYLQKEDLHSAIPNFATIDVSFISLKIILKHLLTILDDNAEVVALIKPQFEAGKELVGKKGIVRDPKVHERVIIDVVTFALNEGYELLGLTHSPITGGEGNIEFLVYLRGHSASKDSQDISDYLDLIEATVSEAHSKLAN